MVPKKIWEKKYHGFEDLADLERDVSEALDPAFGEIKEEVLDPEFQGTLTVTMTYEKPKPEDTVPSREPLLVKGPSVLRDVCDQVKKEKLLQTEAENE